MKNQRPTSGDVWVPTKGTAKPRHVSQGTIGDAVWSFAEGYPTVRWTLRQWETWVKRTGAKRKASR